MGVDPCWLDKSHPCPCGIIDIGITCSLCGARRHEPTMQWMGKGYSEARISTLCYILIMRSGLRPRLDRDDNGAETPMLLTPPHFQVTSFGLVCNFTPPPHQKDGPPQPYKRDTYFASKMDLGTKSFGKEKRVGHVSTYLVHLSHFWCQSRRFAWGSPTITMPHLHLLPIGLVTRLY